LPAEFVAIYVNYADILTVHKNPFQLPLSKS